MEGLASGAAARLLLDWDRWVWKTPDCSELIPVFRKPVWDDLQHGVLSCRKQPSLWSYREGRGDWQHSGRWWCLYDAQLMLCTIKVSAIPSHHHQPEPLIQGRMDPHGLHVTLPSDYCTRNGGSSDQHYSDLVLFSFLLLADSSDTWCGLLPLRRLTCCAFTDAHLHTLVLMSVFEFPLPSYQLTAVWPFSDLRLQFLFFLFLLLGLNRSPVCARIHWFAAILLAD